MSIIWDAEKVAEGLAVVGECRQHMLDALRQLLDDYHGQARTADYYDLLAGMWLEQFMHVTYAAWREETVGAGALLPAGTPDLPITTSPLAFNMLVEHDQTFAQHLRFAIRQLSDGHGPEFWRLRPHVSRDEKSAGTTSWRARGITGLRRTGGAVIRSSVGSRSADLLLCSPSFKGPRLEWLGVMWRWRRWARHDNLDITYPTGVDCDLTWRRRRSIDQQSNGDFLGILRSLLPLVLPSVFLEGFGGLRRCVCDAKIVRPRALYTANALHWNLPFKLLAAEWRERGTLVLNHQHGAGYGIDKVHAVEDYEVRVTDRFYSWGWQRPDCCVRPMGVGITQLHRSTTRIGILLSCVNLPRSVYRLHFSPMPGTIETMIRRTLEFLRTLKTHDDVMVRPYVDDYGQGFTAAMQQAAPFARFDLMPRPSIFARLSESRIVVHNSPGTGFLETLALNMPTVCFFGDESHRFRDAAMPFMQALQEVGILHTSGADAARVARMSVGALDEWWRSAAVQTAREEFCARYALFTPDWAKQWESEFEEVIALAT